MTCTNHTVIIISAVYMRTCVRVFACLCVLAWGGFTFSDLESYPSRYNAESAHEIMMVYGKVAVGATDS